ncbi:MAG: hypothetical protein WC829_21525, partial [Hyphomicrobium sp.]
MAEADEVKERIALLRGWLARRLDAETLAWVDELAARIASGTSAIALARAVGLAPRRVGRDPLQLDDEERANGEAVRP